MLNLNYWLPADQQLPMEAYQSQITQIHKKLHDKEDAYTGWVDWPQRVKVEWVSSIVSSELNFCS